ncbi:hypothetical protein GCM10009721_43350 [Terrabacter tumescens]|uniref:Uncharacterized protein n=1 Tax=Terrabacter tumescens TaxID=60443 RepID=A0ABQ2II28_9MICO|nr:hypothetical protein GCM10009721_43350 [Terrabacter tumescens]
MNVFGEWITYAATLLNPGEINLQAAHNKVKHGLAVHARGDMRVTFVAMPPSQDDTVPVSAFTADNAIDIFDQPVLELLAQGPKVDGHPQGLELTQLRLKPSALLADAFMLAMTHGAMFHVASVQHFEGRDELRTDLRPPDYPGLPSGGPRPVHIDATAPLGMRFPITTPPGGGLAERQAGIGYRTFFQPFSIDYDGRTKAVVVDG